MSGCVRVPVCTVPLYMLYICEEAILRIQYVQPCVRTYMLYVYVLYVRRPYCAVSIWILVYVLYVRGPYCAVSICILVYVHVVC